MMRIVTYDIKKGHDYTDFYEFVEKHNGEKLTESTYAINTPYDQKQFEAKLRSLFQRGDLVYYITVVGEDHRLFYKEIIV